MSHLPLSFNSEGDAVIPHNWTETAPVSQYRKAWHVWDSDSDADPVATVALFPIHERQRASKLIVNSSHPAFQQAVWWRSFAAEYPAVMLIDLHVTRLDLTVDVPRATPSRLAGVMLDEGRRKVTVIVKNGYIETLYLGQDPMVRIYDKGLEEGGDPGTRARLEIQQRTASSHLPDNVLALYHTAPGLVVETVKTVIPVASSTDALSSNQQLLHLRRDAATRNMLVRCLDADRQWMEQWQASMLSATTEYQRTWHTARASHSVDQGPQ